VFKSVWLFLLADPLVIAVLKKFGDIMIVPGKD